MTKLSPSGSVVYSTYLGNSGPEDAPTLAVDPTGHAYMTGIAFASDFPTTPGAILATASEPLFVAKLNVAGSALDYSTYVRDGCGIPYGGIAVDGSGQAPITGQGYCDSGLPLVNPVQTCGTAFVTKLNAHRFGRRLLYLHGRWC